jgi:acyl carrier protein
MTTYLTGSLNDELEIRHSDFACTEGLPHAPGKGVPVRSEPLTREHVVAEIVRAITICTSFPGHELNGETNLALDLGLESMSRVELLIEVERALDVVLDVVEVVVFAELTIAELADLIMPALQEDGSERLRNLA